MTGYAEPVSVAPVTTAGQHQTPDSPGAAVVRPRHHVEAVSRDATRAADEIAAEDRKEPTYFIPNVISWALGEQDQEREQAPRQSDPEPGLLTEQQRQEAGEELRQAAEAAELARRTLDAREARARQAADREAQRQREEPSPARWPHRDPGHQPPRREQEPRTERTPAQLAALAFPDGPRPSPQPPDAPAAEPRRPRPRPRGPERDGPGASR